MEDKIIDQFVHNITEQARQEFLENGPSEPKVYQLVKRGKSDLNVQVSHLNNHFNDNFPERLEKIEDLVEHFHRDGNLGFRKNLCTIYCEWIGTDQKGYLLFQIRKTFKKSQQLLVVQRDGISVNDCGQISESNTMESYYTEDEVVSQ
jgi:hypothetical protein